MRTQWQDNGFKFKVVFTDKEAFKMKSGEKAQW